MILEPRRTAGATGLGYTVKRWPRATHYVVRLGAREVRVIIGDGETANVGAVVALLVAGLFLS